MKLINIIFLATVLFVTQLNLVCAGDAFHKQRQHMTLLIRKDIEQTSKYIGIASFSPKVMSVMGSVYRHEFVPAYQKPYAYQNRPLAIGHGQTISQPYIVALMTHLLKVSNSSKVLEIGTGSGYQAAILANLVDEVFTIEIIEPLGQEAKERLERLGYTNIHCRLGDGYYGIEEHGPYDAIIVTAAASHIPPPLIRQLKPGGRMIIPVGSRFVTQQLLLVEKNDIGRATTRQILPVRFVPLTGGP